MLAFRGTEGVNPFSSRHRKDWVANFLHGFGLKSGQYSDAMDLAKNVLVKTKGNMMVTGHSLGGGLASAASRATGADGITFNAAGIRSGTVKDANPSNIRAHRTRGDILTTTQNVIPFLMPDSAGNQITHGAKHWYSVIGRHNINNFTE